MRQRTGENLRDVGFGLRVIAVEMSFAGDAADHQRARAHEARPDTAQCSHKCLAGPSYAGEQILVDDKTRLDGADTAGALDDKIEVVEAVLQRVFDDFVIAVVFALARERRLPVRRAGKFFPGGDPDRVASGCGRRQAGAINPLVHGHTR